MWTRLSHWWLALHALPGVLGDAGQRTLLAEMWAFCQNLPDVLNAPLENALQSLTPQSSAASPYGEDTLRVLADLAALLDRRSPLGLCLRRSLTRYHYLRRAGIPVKLHFGAKLAHSGQPDRDLSGHAWLTLNDLPYFENPRTGEGSPQYSSSRHAIRIELRMKFFITGLSIGLVLGLAACTVSTSLPTLVPPASHASATAVSLTDTPRSSTATKPTATQANTLTPTVRATAARTLTATSGPMPTDPATVTPATTPTQALTYITYQDFQILPQQATIRVGTTVVFLIKAGLLTFHQPYNFTAPNIFEAPSRLGNDTSFAHTFQEPGTVVLLCGYHADMRATLVVEP